LKKYYYFTLFKLIIHIAINLFEEVFIAIKDKRSCSIAMLFEEVFIVIKNHKEGVVIFFILKSNICRE
jgi:hypothetical protein